MRSARRLMAAFDVAMKQHSASVYKGLGDAFYDERKQVSSRAEAPGHEPLSPRRPAMSPSR